MTRMWGVDPTEMCDDHLLGEHAEMHQEAGTLLNHPHGVAVVEGHVSEQQVDVSLLQTRHGELATELQRRGFNHDSPFEYELDEYHDMGSINVDANRDELASRCEDCF